MPPRFNRSGGFVGVQPPNFARQGQMSFGFDPVPTRTPKLLGAGAAFNQFGASTSGGSPNFVMGASNVSRQQTLPFNSTPARTNRFVDAVQRMKNVGYTRAGLAGAFGAAFSRASIGLELVLGGAFVASGAIQGAARWGATTGLEEDFVGGAVYGGVRGAAGAAGATVGATIGMVAGSAVPVVGTFVGAAVGGVVGDYVGSAMFDDPARRLGMAARAMTRTARATDRIQFGYDGFADTRAAYTMRQAAVMDMSRGMLNARQYLGNEAIFLHER